MNKSLSPDEVCAAFADQRSKLTVRLLDNETVLIEGDAGALQFLGDLLIAQARFERDNGFQISPTGAGSAVFSGEATHGLYIHRVPSDR
jgi:hypothetical protein